MERIKHSGQKLYWERGLLFFCVVGIVACALKPREVFAGASPHFKKVMIVIFENTNYEDAARQPFLSNLSKQGALLSNFYAETHPSQPNYVALVSGSTQGVSSDSNVNVNARHLGDLLETKDLNWKVYAEGYPGNCFLGSRSGTYVRKHVPFISFRNVQGDPARCARIVDAKQLGTDIKGGALPEFSLYIPDLNNDGHDTDIAYADRWLSKTFGPILQDPSFTKDMLFVVTTDESDWSGGNHILTILSGDGIQPGAVSSQEYNHYSLLRTIEEQFGLGTLGMSDATASLIEGVWK